jgi:hypothetical protein
MIDPDEIAANSFRVVGYDPKLFTAIDVVDAPGVAAWRCKHCGRLFLGNVAGNSAGFAHDCWFRDEVVFKEWVRDDRQR